MGGVTRSSQDDQRAEMTVGEEGNEPSPAAETTLGGLLQNVALEKALQHNATALLSERQLSEKQMHTPMKMPYLSSSDPCCQGKLCSAQGQLPGRSRRIEGNNVADQLLASDSIVVKVI